MEKYTQFILGLLRANWLTYIFNQLFSFCAVLGITHRTNISGVQVRTIALLQLSACFINMDCAWYCISCKYRVRSSAGTNCLSFLELPGGKSMCLQFGKHPAASAQWHREQGVPFQSQRKKGELQPDTSLITFIYCIAWQQDTMREALIENFHLVCSPLQDRTGKSGAAVQSRYLWGSLCSLTMRYLWTTSDLWSPSWCCCMCALWLFT